MSADHNHAVIAVCCYTHFNTVFKGIKYAHNDNIL